MKNNYLSLLFKKKNLAFHCIADSKEKTVYLLKFETPNNQLDFVIENVHNQKNMMHIYGVFPVKIPFTKRNEMAILSTLLNNNLDVGCWELDLGNGRLRYRLSYPCDMKSKTFEDIFMKQLHLAVQYTDLCISPILSSVYGNINPHEVYSQFTGFVNVQMN